MRRLRRRFRDQRGQSFTETLLVSWLVVAFICAIYQMFIANEAIYHSITAAHQLLLRAGLGSNCGTPGVPQCGYDPDGNAEVIWNTVAIPEIKIPIISFFGRASLFGSEGLHDVRLVSNVRDPQPEKDCPVPCKKSKMGAGTYMDPDDVVDWVGK